MNQHPTKIRHLNDRVVNNLISNVEQACIKVATATQPPAEVHLRGAFTTTMVVTITNVPRASLHGGRDNPTLMERPKIKILNPGGDLAERILYSALHRRRSSSVDIAPDSPSVAVEEDDISMIIGSAELREYNNREKCDRTIARADTEDEIQQSLDGVISQVIC